MSRWLLRLVLVLLPLIFVTPHLNESFFGTDFLFPYNRIDDTASPLRLWSADYLGDRNTSSFGVQYVLIAKACVFFAGYKQAPHLFVYISILAYLCSALLISGYIRRVFTQQLGQANDPLCVYTDLAMVLIAFTSPVLLGYLTNFFSIGLLLAAAGVMLSLHSVLKYFLTGKYVYLLSAVILSLLVNHPPTFFFHLAVSALIILVRSPKQAIMYGVLALTVNAYWLVPLYMSFFSPDTVSLSADSSYIDHIFNWYENGSSILTSLVFSIYPSNKLFAIVPESLYVVLFTLAYIIIGYAVVRSFRTVDKIRRHLFVTLVTSLLLVLAFSFGGKYETGILFKFFWSRISALHFFKSFTQILNVGFIVFLCLLSASIALVPKSKWRLFVSVGILLTCVTILIRYQFELNRHIERGTIPAEYWGVRQLVNEDPVASRVLKLPEMSYEYFSWNGRWDQYFLVQRWFSKPVVYFGVVVPSVAKVIRPNDGDYTDVFKNNNFRYLVVHHDQDSEKYKPKDFSFDYSVVDLVENNQYFSVYKIKDQYFTPRVVTDTKAEFTRINTLRYQIELSGLTSSTELILMEKFDPGWRLVPAILDESCSSSNGAETFFQRAFRTSLSEASHVIQEGYANRWTIAADEVRRGYGQEYFHENSNGGIDLCLTLYFRPQIYLSLAMYVTFVSSIALVTAIALRIPVIRSRYET